MTFSTKLIVSAITIKLRHPEDIENCTPFDGKLEMSIKGLK